MNKPVAFSKKLPVELGNYFTEFYNNNKHKFDANWTEEEELALKIFGLTEPTMMWERWDAGNKDEGEFFIKIQEMLDCLDIEYTDFSSFIKTEYLPVGVHVDSEFNPDKSKEFYYSFNGGGVPGDAPGYSVILPINTYGPHHETTVFKAKATGNPQLLEKVLNYMNNNVVDDEWNLHNNKANLDYNDYNHVSMNLDYNGNTLLDYLEVEGVIPWEKDTAIAFAKNNFHTSVNFRRHGITHKDFVLVHTNSYPYS